MVRTSIPAAFIAALLAWLSVSVAAWHVRRKIGSVRRRAWIGEKADGSALSRGRQR